MSSFSWEKIAELPWWVYVVYFVFIWLALLSMKARLVSVNSIKRLLITYLSIPLPLLFIQFGIHLDFIMMLLTSFLLGASLGFLYCQIKKMRVNVAEKSIHSPRSWLPLPLMFMFTCAYLYVQPSYGDLVQLWQDARYHFILFGMLGLASGFMLGQLQWANYHLRQARLRA